MTEEINTFAQRCFLHSHEKESFEDRLLELGVKDFSCLGWDSYDESLEIYEVDDAARLSPECQQFIHDSGFCKVYLNHKNGWETHYGDWPDKDYSRPGWRRLKRGDGGFDVSAWSCENLFNKKLLASGYIRIVEQDDA